MSTDPLTAPLRTAYVRGTNGLYYKIGGSGGSDTPEVYAQTNKPAGTSQTIVWVDLDDLGGGGGGGGGGGSDIPEVYAQPDTPAADPRTIVWVDLDDPSGGGSGGGDGEDEVHVGSTPPAGPFPGQMWVDLTGSGGGETDVYADEVYVNSVPPVTPFNGQMWVDLTGEGDGSAGVDEVHVGTTPPPNPFDGQMWVDLTGSGSGGSGGSGSGIGAVFVQTDPPADMPGVDVFWVDSNDTVSSPETTVIAQAEPPAYSTNTVLWVDTDGTTS